MATRALTMTPADILKYQNDLIRTGQALPLGTMRQIAIGPTDGYTPPANDVFIAKYGRLIDFRDQPMMIGQSPDRGMILVMSPMVRRDGYVGLPDVPVPDWVAPPKSEEEITGRVVDRKTGRREPVFGNPARYTPPMIPQRLRDRTNEKLEGTNFLVFSPVEKITFRPEHHGETLGTVWLVDCYPNPVDHTHATLLVDELTGETHFFGGLFDIKRAVGES